MLSIEALTAAVDVRPFNEEAVRFRNTNERLIKLGVAVVVLDEHDRMLVLEHEARDNEFPQGALGPSMETLRFLGPMQTLLAESPMHAWQRSLGEELTLDTPGKITEADLFFARDSVFDLGHWVVPGQNGHRDGRLRAYNMVLRTGNPDMFLDLERTEEIIGTRFMSIDDVLASDLPKRPGFDDWLVNVMSGVDRTAQRLPVIPVYPLELPRGLMPDVRFDNV